MPATAERRTRQPAPPRPPGPGLRRPAPADRLAALLRRRAGDLLALLTIKRPLRLTVPWHAGAGREVRRDSALLDLPPVLAPGIVYCGATACPVESAAELAPVPGQDGSPPRLYPDAPGRYRVELEVTGDVTARETVEVEVGGS